MIQLNNISSPSMFKNGRSVVSYLKRDESLASLYNGMTVSVVKSLLFLPTFVLVQKGLEEGSRRAF
jgi:hypothetical protein